MHQDLWQLDLQTLIDMLAEETQKYTKAFISGNQKESANHRVIIDALIVEIKSRKQSEFSDLHSPKIPSE